MAAQARLEGGGPERGPRLSVARGRWMPAGPRPQSRGRPPPCPGPPDPQAGDRPPPGPPASTKWLTPSSGLGRRTQGSRRADLLFILPSARPFRCPGSERPTPSLIRCPRPRHRSIHSCLRSGCPPPSPAPPPQPSVPSLASPGRAGAGPAGPEEVASDPSPSLGEAAGRRETEWDGLLLGALCRPGPPLTSGSSSVKREPLYRQGKQCVGCACGCSSRKTLGTRGPSQVLLAGRPTGTGGA